MLSFDMLLEQTLAIVLAIVLILSNAAWIIVHTRLQVRYEGLLKACRSLPSL